MSGFYLRDARSNVGSSCTFWALNGNGYTTNLDKAHVYTQEEAQYYIDSRHTDVPLSKALVDELATVRVDHQYLDECMAGLAADCDQYVVHCMQGEYDGNDVYWKADEGGCSVNLSEALVLTRAEVEAAAKVLDSVTIYRLEYVQSISRRTFQVNRINERRMVTAAGVRKPKRRRERQTTGRNRGNCPKCGRVTWGFNPNRLYTCAEAVREKHGCGDWLEDCESAVAFAKELS